MEQENILKSLFNLGNAGNSADILKAVYEELGKIVNPQQPEKDEPQKPVYNNMTPEEEKELIIKNLILNASDFDPFIDNLWNINNSKSLLDAFNSKVNDCEDFIKTHPIFLKRLNKKVHDDVIFTCDEQTKLNEDKLHTLENILEFIETYKHAIEDFRTITTHSKNYYQALKDAVNG